jgi:hypothetical protein
MGYCFLRGLLGQVGMTHPAVLYRRVEALDPGIQVFVSDLRMGLRRFGMLGHCFTVAGFGRCLRMRESRCHVAFLCADDSGAEGERDSR